ncbi:MAG: HAD family hydrolase [Candidatus Scalindua sp.]
MFDLDGTLIDSKLDIANAVNETFRKFSRPELENEHIYSYVGTGVQPLIEKFMGSAEEGDITMAFSVFRSYYEKHLLDNTELYPGVREVLNELTWIRKALISNKSERFIKKILKGLKIDSYFDIDIGGDSLPNRKPHPDSVNLVIEKTGVDKENTLLVGDSKVDIETGKRAGVWTCGVSYGYGDRKELIKSGADWIIEEFPALKGLIKR